MDSFTPTLLPSPTLLAPRSYTTFPSGAVGIQGPPNSTRILPNVTAADQLRCPSTEMPSFINDTFAKGTPYCQVNFAQFIPELSACCGNETINVYQNCTMYCKTSKTLAMHDWTTCLKMALVASKFGEEPGVKLERFGTGCSVAKGAISEGGRVIAGSMGVLFGLLGLMGSWVVW